MTRRDKPEYGSAEYWRERALVKDGTRQRAKLLEDLRCKHGELPRRCRRCDPIDPATIPF